MGCVSSANYDRQSKDSTYKDMAISKFEPLQLQLLQLLFTNLSGRCRHNLVTRQTFDVFFHSSGLVGEIIFIKFDSKKNGTIDYSQFVQAFEIMIKGSKTQKADVLFQIYNISKTGGIKYSQLLKILFSYPLQNLNEMLVEESFLKFIGENQLSYYFGTQNNKLLQRNIVEQQSQMEEDNNNKHSHQKQAFSSSILYKLTNQADQQSNHHKRDNIQQFKINSNRPSVQTKTSAERPKKRTNTSVLLSIESFKKKNVKVSSNISSLTKKYANFLFQSYNLDKDKDQFSRQNFYKLLEEHPALFNVYASGFHSYIWQISNGSPQYLSMTAYIQGEAHQVCKSAEEKVYIKLIRTTIFIFSHFKSKIPTAVITLEGLTVMAKQREEEHGFMVKHRDGLYPIRQYYFKFKSVQEEWLRQLADFKQNSFQDNFVLLQRIGGGQFSNVFKGREKSTNKQVAIKMIESFKLSSDQREVIKRQCSILKQCHHPNIVKYCGQYKAKSELYIVTELLTEGDLFEYTKKNGFLQEFQAAIIFRQLVDTILYVNNSLGIIHRDLKPQNVMIIMNQEKKHVNKIKLIDFGFGVFKDKLSELPLREKYAGTTGFLAPEIYFREEYDEKIDTFSLGIILYFMISGYLPFQSNFPHEVEDLTKNCNYSIENVHWSNISEDAKDLIEKTLTFKDKRLSTKEVSEHRWLRQADELKGRIGVNKKSSFIRY